MMTLFAVVSTSNNASLYDVLFARAQTPPPLDTFYSGGVISSMNPTSNETMGHESGKAARTITAPILYNLKGTWTLNVTSGNASLFDARFTMAKATNNNNDNESNNTHIHEITDFRGKKSGNVQLTPDGDAFIVGTANVKTNGFLTWKDVDTAVIINRLNEVSIVLDTNATAGHFGDRPLHGFVQSLRDASGNEMIARPMGLPAGGESSILAGSSSTSTSPSNSTNQPSESHPVD
jgi:hypothetical protein